MDSKATSTTWYDAITNRKGRIFEEFPISNQLNIANENSALTTFESARGTSNVDLTVADSTMIKLLHTWKCNEKESFSDHTYINFRIAKLKTISQGLNYNGVKYITSETGFQHSENFLTEIKNKFRIMETLDLDDTLCE